MPPNGRAGRSAHVEKYTKTNEDDGYVVNCLLCRKDGKSWSSRVAAKRLLGSKRQARSFDSWADVMDLWTVHMMVQHPDDEPPNWRLSSDVDDEVFDSATRFFEPSEQEDMLRKIFGQKPLDEVRDRERKLNRIRKAAARLGHKVSLPAEKIPGVSKASQGWVCTCGAAGHAEPQWDAGAQRDAGRRHVLEAIEAHSAT